VRYPRYVFIPHSMSYSRCVTIFCLS